MQQITPWLKTLKETILEKDLLDLRPPSLDSAFFAKRLQEKLQVEDLALETTTLGWLDRQGFEKGLGEDVFYVGFMLSPLQGEFYWAMSEDDISKICSWLITKDSKIESFSSEILQEGFYRHVLLETLDLLDQTEPLQGLSPKILSKALLPTQTCYGVDIKIKYKNHSCWGRLCFSKQFLSSWKNHAKETFDIFSSEIAKKSTLLLSLQSGYTKLSLDLFKTLKVGDFIILDRGSFDPNSMQGTSLLYLEDMPLFQVKIKQDKIKILDYSYYQEETMENKQTENIAPPETEPTHVESAETEVATKPLAIEKVDLTIQVELAKIKMNVSKLSKLQPGDTLELPLSLENPVNLILNGHVVARAELTNLGEALGARILELG